MNAGWRCRCIRAVRGATLLPMKPSTTAIAADFTPGERNYIRLEFDMSFSRLRSAADRSQLKAGGSGRQGSPSCRPSFKGYWGKA